MAASGTKGTTKGDVGKSKWHAMFQQLLQFKEKHDHTLVPNRYLESPQLGSWVSTQRRQYKVMLEKQRLEAEGKGGAMLENNEGFKGSPMSPERAKILEDIGFVWSTTDPRRVPWTIRLSQLVEFKQLYGHCLVPIKYPANPQLSNWVSAQRQEYKIIQGGRPSNRLTADKIKALDELGFVWEAQRGGPRRKQELVSLPTSNYSESESSPVLASESQVIDSWSSSQKSHSEDINTNSSSSAEADEKSAAAELLMSFYQDNEKKLPFKKRRTQDERAKSANNKRVKSSGALPVPNEIRGALSADVEVVTKKCSEIILHDGPHRAAADEGNMLVSIARPVSPNNYASSILTTWEGRYQELVEYKKKHGDTLVPASSIEFQQLSAWVSHQRELYKKEQTRTQYDSLNIGLQTSVPHIPAERIELLNMLGFAWDVHVSTEADDGWKGKFQELARYKEVHGNTMVPNKFAANPQLAKWVSTQRRQYKILTNGGDSTITRARLDSLNEIGFVWEVKGKNEKKLTSPGEEAPRERVLPEKPLSACSSSLLPMAAQRQGSARRREGVMSAREKRVSSFREDKRERLPEAAMSNPCLVLAAAAAQSREAAARRPCVSQQSDSSAFSHATGDSAARLNSLLQTTAVADQSSYLAMHQQQEYARRLAAASQAQHHHQQLSNAHSNLNLPPSAQLALEHHRFAQHHHEPQHSHQEPAMPAWFLANLQMQALAEEEQHRRLAIEELFRQQENTRRMNIVAALNALSNNHKPYYY